MLDGRISVPDSTGLHPETCKHCRESDIKLSTGVAPGEFKLYKCKNNMWDIVTPIMVEGQHVGNIFSGQFFFDDEPLDYELFRSQARKYGFNEEEYIAALEKVPRLSRETVNIGMSFFMKFANMVSQLSYSNIKLAQSLAERDTLVDKLQENRKDFDRAQAVGNIGSWRLNVCKNELTWSDENHRIFGIPKGTPLTYETFLSTVHPDDRKYVDKEWKAGLATEPYDIEHRIIVDGKIKWVREKAYIEFDNDGVLLGGFGITQDITDRKQAEETLAFERSQLLSIFDGIDDVVYVTDPYTYEVLYANKAMKEKFGGELVGGICYREFQWRDSPCDFCTNPIILKKSDKPYHWEYYNPSVDRYFMIMDRIIKWPDGRDVRFEIAKDITERKRAEEALKKAHDTLEEKVKERTAELEEAYNSLKESEERLAEAQKIAHVGSYDWNIATNEEYWSDELYRIFGLDPQFELNHNTFLNCTHPEDLEYVSHAINEALNGKPYNIDYRIILPDGEERVIYSQGGVIFDEKNTPIRMRGIVQDITERKKAEESLSSIEIARKKEIHHRIKNNLQVISSLLDLQAEKFGNRKWIKDSEVIEAYKESQNRVISMALIHEELYKGGGFEMLNFSPYIEKLAENLFRTYRLGSTDVSLNIDLEENALFDMDTAVPLGIIVNELVSNSLKYAFIGKDKGEIGVKLRRDENVECKSEGCKSTAFILTVSDNGVGIPDNLDIEDLNSLGLQLVTSLVDQLDGELELKKSNGTEFIIRFTVRENNNPEPATVPQLIE